MLILAVDTALEACAAGVARPGQESVIRSEIIGRGHAERIFGLIAEVLAEAGLSIGAIDRFAVTVGPGSFTGIRVGIAAVRGFALATGKPATGFSTLAVHAASARLIAGDRPVMAALAAKGGEVFAQMFDSHRAALTEPSVGAPASFVAPALSVGATLAGSGADAIAAAAASGGLPIAHRASVPDMRALLLLAAEALDAGMSPPRPLYIRPPDAVPTAVREGAAR
jgi:tRNA threonylcarbamoyladenosine biosynthesis protein TsaB